jgi:rhodanese-related sulfurtransferase
VIVVMLALLACGGGAPADVSETKAEAPASKATTPTSLKRADVDVAALAEARQAGSTIVDVRTPEEFAAGHVPGAVNVPVDSVHPDNPFFSALPKDKPIYLVCHSGSRSARAADALAAGGFQANNVLGGTEAWIAAGHAVD